jgi:hypothetical protein
LGVVEVPCVYSAIPVMRTPARAKRHPRICLFLKVFLSITLVKKAVETMTMLLVMLNTDPDRKFSAIISSELAVRSMASGMKQTAMGALGRVSPCFRSSLE